MKKLVLRLHSKQTYLLEELNALGQEQDETAEELTEETDKLLAHNAKLKEGIGISNHLFSIFQKYSA